MTQGELSMVKIELLSVDETDAVYKYFPEQETENYGVISVNRKTGERSIRQKALKYGSEYAFHACREIERYIAKNDFKSRGLVAWY